MLEITIAPAKQKTTAPENIMDRIKTMEDVYAALGITGNVFEAKFDESLNGDTNAISAFVQLVLLAKVLNEGWKPDWKNSKEYKYYPWFNLESGFVLYHVNYYSTDANATSRLCFKSETLAKYAATQFTDLWKTYFTIKS